MILPIFDYWDVFFNQAANKTLINKLQVLQNSAIRIVCKLPKRANTQHDETDLGLLPLSKRRQLHCIQLAYLFTVNPMNLARSSSRNIRTRSITAPKKAICERSFRYQIRKTWNSLPTFFHTAADKAALTKFLFTNTHLL